MVDMENKHKMKIISFEGLDKSGKRTQSDLLAKELSERGYNVVRSEFHRYDTPTGKLIRQFLDGEYKVPQAAIECIMAADKFAQLDWFKELEEQGIDVLILDRYKTSQCVYSMAQGITFTPELLDNFMPDPDFEFYLDISVEESMSRKGEHGENDIYERNRTLLEKVKDNYDSYFDFLNGYADFAVIKAERPEMEIHQDILSHALEILE